MKISISSSPMDLIQCVNPYTNKWQVRYFIKEYQSELIYAFENFDYKPSLEEIQKLLIDYIDSETHRKIIEGFTWNGKKIWLSRDNQMNYKTMYDVAIQTAGDNLPKKIKVGDTTPEYYVFSTVKELHEFYFKIDQHIQECLEEGWNKKDSIDLSKYE